MIPVTVLQFLSKYKHQIGYTLTALFCGVAMWYGTATIKDHYWQRVAARQTAEIVQLQQKITTDDMRIAKLDGQLTIASANVAVAEQTAQKVQAKVDKLLAKYEPGVNMQDPHNAVLPPMPIVPNVFVDLPECQKTVATLQADMGTMVEEIKVDRTLIGDLKVENNILEQKSDALDSENDTLKEVTQAQTKVIEAKDKQISAEKTKTKIWKWVAVVGTVAAGLLL